MPLKLHLLISLSLPAFILFLFIAPNFLYAQNRPDTSFQATDKSERAAEDNKGTSITVYGGLNIPTDEFSSTLELGSGYAITGGSFGIEANRFWNKIVKVGVGLNLSLNNFDNAAAQEQFFSIFNKSATANSSPWILVSPNLSIGFILPNDLVSVYGNYNIGVLLGSAPEVTFTADTISVIRDSYSLSSVQSGFSFGVIFARKIDLHIEYWSAEPKSDQTIRMKITTIPDYGIYSTYSGVNKISAIRITLGVVL
jgi:hypothetical protein